MAGRNTKSIAAVGALGAFAMGALMSAPNAVRAQTLGDVGAASAASSAMNAGSNSGTMAVGSRAAQDARRLGSSSGSYEARAGGGEVGSGSGSGGPNFPGADGRGGSSSGSSSGSGEGGSGEGGAAAAPPPPPSPVRWNKLTGMDYLRELLGQPTRAKATGKIGSRQLSKKQLGQAAAQNALEYHRQALSETAGRLFVVLSAAGSL